MLLHVSIDRRGDQFAGSISRPSDQAAVQFWGVMELLAALDQLVPAGPEPTGPPAAPGPAEIHDGACWPLPSPKHYP